MLLLQLNKAIGSCNLAANAALRYLDRAVAVQSIVERYLERNGTIAAAYPRTAISNISKMRTLPNMEHR